MRHPRHLLAGLWLLPLAALAGDPPPIAVGVEGMVCRSCSRAVERELRALPGVKEARVDLKTGRAEVVPEDGARLDAGDLRRAIDAAGFTPVAIDATTGDGP